MQASLCSETVDAGTGSEGSESPVSFKLQAAIARYSGWQIAYILWGKCHLVPHATQDTFLSTCGGGCGEEGSRMLLSDLQDGWKNIPHTLSGHLHCTLRLCMLKRVVTEGRE